MSSLIGLYSNKEITSKILKVRYDIKGAKNVLCSKDVVGVTIGEHLHNPIIVKIAIAA